MGVLNVTPDSFSDGGKHFDRKRAIARALEIESAGADLLDIGGESTRPGSQPVSTGEEFSRVLPVLQGLHGKLQIPISIDTSKSEVAESAAAVGVEIVNDVTALRADPRLAAVARIHGMPLILMHMRGEPLTMQKGPFARNALNDVIDGLRRAVAVAHRAGVKRTQIVLDPGLGFGKRYEQNFELMASLPRIAKLGFPLLVGPSRKSFVGRAAGVAPEESRVMGTAAAVVASILQGAHIVRVHDVKEIAQAARVADAILENSGSTVRR